MVTKILDLKSCITSTYKRIVELEVQKKADIEEVKKSYITRFERLYPITDITTNLKYDNIEFYYKGKDIFSLDTCDGILRPSTYLTMGGSDKEKSDFEIERFILIGKIAEYTRTQYSEIVSLLEDYEVDKNKVEYNISNQSNKLYNLIYEYKNNMFEFKMDWVIDFYKSEKDLKFIPSNDRYIKIGRYTNRFDSIEITNVTKSKKTWNLRLYNGEIFNVVGLYARSKDFKETIRTLFDFSLEYNKYNNNN